MDDDDSKALPPAHEKGHEEKREDIGEPEEADAAVDSAEEQAQLDIRSTPG